MRLVHISSLLSGATLLGATLLGAIQPSYAQSAYDYPWCAVYTNRSGAQACYYRSYAQCMATMQGIGGYCIESPYYRGEPRRERRTRRSSDY
jgi:hypothetical protein